MRHKKVLIMVIGLKRNVPVYVCLWGTSLTVGMYLTSLSLMLVKVDSVPHRLLSEVVTLLRSIFDTCVFAVTTPVPPTLLTLPHRSAGSSFVLSRIWTENVSVKAHVVSIMQESDSSSIMAYLFLTFDSYPLSLFHPPKIRFRPFSPH